MPEVEIAEGFSLALSDERCRQLRDRLRDLLERPGVPEDRPWRPGKTAGPVEQVRASVSFGRDMPSAAGEVEKAVRESVAAAAKLYLGVEVHPRSAVVRQDGLLTICTHEVGGGFSIPDPEVAGLLFERAAILVRSSFKSLLGGVTARFEVR